MQGKSREDYLVALNNMIVPDFSPDPGVKIQADDKEPVSFSFYSAVLPHISSN